MSPRRVAWCLLLLAAPALWGCVRKSEWPYGAPATRAEPPRRPDEAAPEAPPPPAAAVPWVPPPPAEAAPWPPPREAWGETPPPRSGETTELPSAGAEPPPNHHPVPAGNHTGSGAHPMPAPGPPANV